MKIVFNLNSALSQNIMRFIKLSFLGKSLLSFCFFCTFLKVWLYIYNHIHFLILTLFMFLVLKLYKFKLYSVHLLSWYLILFFFDYFLTLRHAHLKSSHRHVVKSYLYINTWYPWFFNIFWSQSSSCWCSSTKCISGHRTDYHQTPNIRYTKSQVSTHWGWDYGFKSIFFSDNV